ncbi:MAG: GNAT family N-acetyltransferase [Chitinophagia bacterium]|nr:GNAT family N-acetyltransferase [Chitinophagia bacterium]
MEAQIQWTLKAFDALTPHELYAILRLRSEVFVVEQQCIFLDTDDKDQPSWHLTLHAHGSLQAYARLLPPGLAYPEASIGRVVSSPATRRQGYGRKLMEKSVEECLKLYGQGDIVIGAQLYLKAFYGSFGFVAEEDVYMEDGIPHVKMRLA